MNELTEIIGKIEVELLKAKSILPQNDYKDGAKDGYISGLTFSLNLLKEARKILNDT